MLLWYSNHDLVLSLAPIVMRRHAKLLPEAVPPLSHDKYQLNPYDLQYVLEMPWKYHTGDEAESGGLYLCKVLDTSECVPWLKCTHGDPIREIVFT